MKNKKQTLEHRRKNSEGLKEYYKTHNPWNKGKKYHNHKKTSEEGKENISKSLQEYYKNNSQWNKGLEGYLVHTNETKKKISDGNKGIPQSLETREKRRLAMLGKNTGKHTEEHKKKISIGVRRAISEGKIVGKKRSIETRKKDSKRMIKTIKSGKIKKINTKPERELKQVLGKYNIKYEPQFEVKNEDGFTKLYDFKILNSNILIEVDGIYWHSKNINDEDIKNDNLKHIRKNDYYKDKLALDKGYNLIRVWSDEIDIFGEYCKIFQPVLSNE